MGYRVECTHTIQDVGIEKDAHARLRFGAPVGEDRGDFPVVSGFEFCQALGRVEFGGQDRGGFQENARRISSQMSRSLGMRTKRRRMARGSVTVPRGLIFTVSLMAAVLQKCRIATSAIIRVADHDAGAQARGVHPCGRMPYRPFMRSYFATKPDSGRLFPRKYLTLSGLSCRMHAYDTRIRHAYDTHPSPSVRPFPRWS